MQDVSKDFPPGGLTVIAGPSGSGKSSLLRILACVDRPSHGWLEIDSMSVARARRTARRRLRRFSIGYIFQDPIDNLVEYLTVAEQLRLAARLRGQRLTDPEILALLEPFGLQHRLNHTPRRLSGGEQQRIAVACSTVGSPALVVADEPTAELDSTSADAVLDAIGVMCRSGAAFVIASHDPRVISRADHLLRLDHGRIAESW